MGKSAPKAPAAPDPAKTTAAEAAANRLTTYRPDGTLATQYGYLDPQENFVGGAPPGSDLPQYAVQVHENDFEQGIRQTQEGAAQQGATQIAQNVNQLATVPAYDPSGATISQQIYDRSANLMRDDVERGRRRLDNNLQARGLPPGSEAYNRALQQALETENQTFSTLALDSTLAGQAENRADYGTQEAERGSRLNELAGLLGGGYAPGAVQTPQGGAPLSVGQAYQNQYQGQLNAYNAAQQQQQAQLQGVSGLASTAVGLMAKSHSSLKDRIGRIMPERALAIVRDLAFEAWRYKGDNEIHVGPMAEKMHARTGLGRDDAIFVLDLIGIVGAAAQALDARIAKLEGAVA